MKISVEIIEEIEDYGNIKFSGQKKGIPSGSFIFDMKANLIGIYKSKKDDMNNFVSFQSICDYLSGNHFLIDFLLIFINFK